MRLKDLYLYVESENNLVKIIPTIEVDPESMENDFYVTCTKATYHFSSEDEADEKINYARQLVGFQKCDKKFKPGKVNKSGEVVRDDLWIVNIQIAH